MREERAGGAPKVLYILGTGRSGSTILGITLGNCAEVLYAGELHLWIGKDGRSPLGGEERRRFWGAVRERVSVELTGPQARSLEQSAALARVDRWPARRRLRSRYLRVAEQLFDALSEQSGARFVVDSSHFPRRARELQRVPTIELYLLFLIRDPHAVVASYSRDDAVFPRFNLLTTNLYIWLTYLLSLAVFLRHPRKRRLLVRYESFIADPEGVLRDILDCVGSEADVPDLGALRTGLAFQGNPVAKSDVVALDRGARRPPRRSPLTTLAQLPWAAVFARLGPAARRSDRASGAPRG